MEVNISKNPLRLPIWYNNNNSSIDINNVVFSGLQIPLYFDFGWKRSAVNIQDNYFINNKGKVTVIQVLNPPFNLSNEANAIDFKLINKCNYTLNLFIKIFGNKNIFF